MCTDIHVHVHVHVTRYIHLYMYTMKRELLFIYVCAHVLTLADLPLLQKGDGVVAELTHGGHFELLSEEPVPVVVLKKGQS